MITAQQLGIKEKCFPYLERHGTMPSNISGLGGGVVLMVMDATFTAAVPKVEEFSKKFMDTGRILNAKIVTGDKYFRRSDEVVYIGVL
jgi:hypothetical protein